MRTSMTYREYMDLFAEAVGSFCYISGGGVRTVKYMAHWPANRCYPLTAKEAREEYPVEVAV